MDNLSTIFLALSLIIIMFGMGLSLTVDNFKNIFVNPKAIIAGLISQLLILPAIAFSLVLSFNLQPEIAVGVIILAACPGGPTSNLITHLAKGDTALSVSLTAVSSLLTLITIPFIINLGLQIILGKNTEIHLDILQTIAQIFVIVIIPVLLGMIIKAKKGGFALKMEKPVRIASAIVFVLVLAGVILGQKENIIPYFKQAGLVMITLNVLTMLLGLAIARFLRLSFKQAVSISIETGIQNGTLAITIATVLLSNPTYSIAPAIYSLIMFITGSMVILWSLNRLKRG